MPASTATWMDLPCPDAGASPIGQQPHAETALDFDTHWESQSVVQQYGSLLQTEVTHAEQDLTSGPPVAHGLCAHWEPQAVAQELSL